MLVFKARVTQRCIITRKNIKARQNSEGAIQQKITDGLSKITQRKLSEEEIHCLEVEGSSPSV